MRNLFFIMSLTVAALCVAGCGRTLNGPRFWWDDRNQERLSDDYRLPADPAAPADYRAESYSDDDLSGGDELSEDSLRDYHTNLDQEEEKRKSEASLLDF